MVNMIAATTTKTGLKVRSRIDPRQYATGLRISNAELAEVHLVPDKFMANGTTQFSRKRRNHLIS